jgi:hypothetical protein
LLKQYRYSEEEINDVRSVMASQSREKSQASDSVSRQYGKLGWLDGPVRWNIRSAMRDFPLLSMVVGYEAQFVIFRKHITSLPLDT